MGYRTRFVSGLLLLAAPAAAPPVIILTQPSRNVVLQRDPHPRDPLIRRALWSHWFARQPSLCCNAPRTHLGAFLAMYRGLT